MLFHDYISHRERIFREDKKGYERNLNQLFRRLKRGTKDYIEAVVAGMDFHWFEDRKPYYNVWPGIMESLSKMDLDNFDSKHFRLSQRSLVLRLPTKNNLLEPIETMLIWCEDPRTYCVVRGAEYACCMGMERKENEPIGNAWECAESIGTIKFPSDLLIKAMKLLASICLIDVGNTDLLVPDVLASDRDRFERCLTDAERAVIVERAARRKGRGFDLGKPRDDGSGYAVSPHPMLFWTGKGRTIPRIIVRKGWVTKRLKEMPHGYEATSLPGGS